MRGSSVGMLLSIVIVLTLAGCAGSGSLDPDNGRLEKVRVGTTTLPASAPVYVAEALGFFEAEGLDVELSVYDAGALAMQDALDGKLDYATVAQTPIARAALERKPLQVLMTICEVDNLNYIVARKDRKITTAADLVGKRIGFVRGTTGDFFLHIYLTTSRIPVRRIREVPLKPSEIAFALTSGRVDGVSSWVPITVQLKRALGDNAIVLDEPGLYTTYWNVVTGATEPDKETSQRLIRAIARANRYMAENPKAAIAVTAPKFGMSEADLLAQWPDLRWKTSLDQSLVLALEDEARWMVEEGQSEGTTRTPDFLDHMDAAPLRAEDPDKVTVIEAPGH